MVKRQQVKRAAFEYAKFKKNQTENDITEGTKTNIDAGLAHMASELRMAINKNQRIPQMSNLWNKITEVKIERSWICILHTKDLNEGEIQIVIQWLKTWGFYFTNKPFEWKAKGKRKDFGYSKYIALGPWSKKNQLWGGTTTHQPGYITIS